MSRELRDSYSGSTESYVLTQHARQRMFSRGLSTAAIDAGLAWVRTVDVRGGGDTRHWLPGKSPKPPVTEWISRALRGYRWCAIGMAPS